MASSATANIGEALVDVLDELSEDWKAEVLDFALFLQGKQATDSQGELPKVVERLEDLWGDFWPEDESVDLYADAVRR